jgi:hypothetical protein
MSEKIIHIRLLIGFYLAEKCYCITFIKLDDSLIKISNNTKVVSVGFVKHNQRSWRKLLIEMINNSTVSENIDASLVGCLHTGEDFNITLLIQMEA